MSFLTTTTSCFHHRPSNQIPTTNQHHQPTPPARWCLLHSGNFVSHVFLLDLLFLTFGVRSQSTDLMIHRYFWPTQAYLCSLLQIVRFVPTSFAFSTVSLQCLESRPTQLHLPILKAESKQRTTFLKQLFMHSEAHGASEHTTDDTKQRRRKKNKKATKWIACSSTKEVTRAIQLYVQEGDKVAELGSQLRDSSIALCEAIGPDGKALLVDIERKFPKVKKNGQRQQRTSAMRREGEEENFYRDRATFVETKGFEFWRSALFFQSHHDGDAAGAYTGRRLPYNVLVVDVSTVAGNDLDLTCISLVKEFVSLNQGSGDDENSCRVVIIKSGSLHDLARRLFHAQRIFSGVQSLKDISPSNAKTTSIIGTVGVEEYRKTIPFVVEAGDVVLEVGSHFGTSTALLNDAAKGVGPNGPGGCLGVDVGTHIIKSAKKKFPHVPFEVGDAWKTAQLARMRSNHFEVNSSSMGRIYDAVYVDVGGLSGNEGLLEAVSLLSSIANSLEPRTIVIKSLCMRRLASNLVPFSEVWKKERLKQFN